MLTLRHRFYATPGKEAELRAFLAEWVKMAQGQGERAGLAQRIFSSEGPVLVVPRWYDDMTALDARRRANQADAEWQARATRLSTMVREPARQTIEEILVPPAASTAPIGIVLRAFFQPALGKIGDVRSILDEHVRSEQAAGRGQIILAQGVFSETGPLLTITATHANLAELARLREERASSVQAVMAGVAGAFALRWRSGSLEVVVSPQS